MRRDSSSPRSRLQSSLLIENKKYMHILSFRMYEYMYLHTCRHAHVYIYIEIHTPTHCTHVYVCWICVFLYMFINDVCACMYIYIYLPEPADYFTPQNPAIQPLTSYFHSKPNPSDPTSGAQRLGRSQLDRCTEQDLSHVAVYQGASRRPDRYTLICVYPCRSSNIQTHSWLQYVYMYMYGCI